MAETIGVLDVIYHRSAMELSTAVEMLLDHRSLAIQDTDVVAKALALFRAQPALGFSDCLMVELARKAGHLPLGAFDPKLGQVEGAQKL